MRPIRACVGRWNKVPLVLVFGVCIARSQLVPPLLDTSQQRQQAIRVGMTRIAFTSVFFGDALVEQLVAGGTLSIQQQYRGTSLLTGIRSFRDDELLRLQWRYPIAESLMLVPHVEWDVSNDSRSLGISRLERVRGAAGVGYSSLIGRAEAYAGAEQAEQLGIRERGLVFGGRLQTQSDRLRDFMLTGTVAAERTQLERRMNADIGGRLVLSTKNTNAFQLALEYNRQRRDYYTTLGIGADIALEHRSEQRWALDGWLRQEIGPAELVIAPQLSLLQVERFFDSPTPLSGLTYVRRELHQFDGGVGITLFLSTSHTLHQVGLDIRQRNETNGTYDLFAAPTPQLVEDVRQSERIRDNQSARLQLWTAHAVQLSSHDSLAVQAQSAIVRYDTPSPLNYDDRDELSVSAQARYIRQWSPAHSSVVTFEYAAVHFVFLRAQRSALSNWNRSFRLAASMPYALGRVQWNPSLEILAQYTSYDFEGLSGVPPSFSFRQLTYRDSFRLVLEPLDIEAQVYLRWFLRGDFSWAQFAERPTGNGRELFGRIMFWHRVTEQLACGIGARWYELSQQLQLASLAGLSSQQRSVAPDVGIRLTAGELELRVSGWYELRRVGSGALQEVPNLQLTVVRAL